MFEGSAVISAALRPTEAIMNTVTHLMANFHQIVLSQTPYRSVSPQRTLDSAGRYTPRSRHQRPHATRAEPPCAGSPHWDKEPLIGRAQDSVWQTE